MITVRQQAQVRTGGSPVLAPPKSRASRRSIRIARATADVLSEQRQFLEERWRESGIVPIDGGFVFPREDGSLRRPDLISKDFTAYAKAAGLKARFHSLRHGAATLMLEAGVPDKAAAHRLGHSSASITTDVYQHISPDVEDFAANAIDRALGALDDPGDASRVT